MSFSVDTFVANLQLTELATLKRSELVSLVNHYNLEVNSGMRCAKACQKVSVRPIVKHFYWPGVHRDVKNFIIVCHTCQMVGKPNQKQPVAPLKPIPVLGEPFSHVLIDCVGPLPKQKRG